MVQFLDVGEARDDACRGALRLLAVEHQLGPRHSGFRRRGAAGAGVRVMAVGGGVMLVVVVHNTVPSPSSLKERHGGLAGEHGEGVTCRVVVHYHS